MYTHVLCVPPCGLISAPDQPSQLLVHCDFEILEGGRDRVAWGALRVCVFATGLWCR